MYSRGHIVNLVLQYTTLNLYYCATTKITAVVRNKQLEAEQRDVFTRSGAQDSGTAVAVIDGARGRRKPTHALTDTMQNWENDKRISLTYSQTLCYSRTWRTKVVCSSLMHTQTFTQTRRCRRTCKSACHRVRRLASSIHIPVSLHHLDHLSMS